MKNNYLFTDAMIPGTQGMFRWDQESRSIKNILLRNSQLQEYEMSSLTLDTIKITVMDMQGFEHDLLVYDQVKQFSLDFANGGKGLRTGIVRDLLPGAYRSIRFYLDRNSQSSKDELMLGLDYIHFDIVEGLEVKKGEFASLLLYLESRASKQEPVMNLFKRLIIGNFAFKKWSLRNAA
jgi:hypothetical protein